MLFKMILDPHTILPLVLCAKISFLKPPLWEEEERFQHVTQYQKLREQFDGYEKSPG